MLVNRYLPYVSSVKHVQTEVIPRMRFYSIRQQESDVVTDACVEHRRLAGGIAAEACPAGSHVHHTQIYTKVNLLYTEIFQGGLLGDGSYGMSRERTMWFWEDRLMMRRTAGELP